MSPLTHKQPRSEVASRVEGVAAVKAKAHPEAEDREAGHPGHQGGAGAGHQVPLVRHRADGECQQSRGQNLSPGVNNHPIAFVSCM